MLLIKSFTDERDTGDLIDSCTKDNLAPDLAVELEVYLDPDLPVELELEFEVKLAEWRACSFYLFSISTIAALFYS